MVSQQQITNKNELRNNRKPIRENFKAVKKNVPLKNSTCLDRIIDDLKYQTLNKNTKRVLTKSPRAQRIENIKKFLYSVRLKNFPDEDGEKPEPNPNLITSEHRGNTPHFCINKLYSASH